MRPIPACSQFDRPPSLLLGGFTCGPSAMSVGAVGRAMSVTVLVTKNVDEPWVLVRVASTGCGMLENAVTNIMRMSGGSLLMFRNCSQNRGLWFALDSSLESRLRRSRSRERYCCQHHATCATLEAYHIRYQCSEHALVFPGKLHSNVLCAEHPPGNTQSILVLGQHQ